MWPQVPIIHMYYRMTQLARAFALNAALSGPAYISTILVRSGTTLLSCQLVQMCKANPLEDPVPSSQTVINLMCLQAVAPSSTYLSSQAQGAAHALDSGVSNLSHM